MPIQWYLKELDLSFYQRVSLILIRTKQCHPSPINTANTTKITIPRQDSPAISLAHYFLSFRSRALFPLIFFWSCKSPYNSASAVGGHPGT